MKKFFYIEVESIERKIMYNDSRMYNYNLILIKRRRFIDKFVSFFTNNEYPFRKTIIKLLTRRTYKDIKLLIPKSENNIYVFIISARIYERYGESLISMLKKEYPKTKVVCYFTDLISTFKTPFVKYKSSFDKIFTFDMKEAQKYDMIFCQEPFEYCNLEKKKKKYDITFVGKAKDRYDDIIHIYENLIERGYICDFHIVGVNKKEQKYQGNIEYNRYMDFKEILSHVRESKCILEIMQDGAYSPTTRHSEAMLYEANLLTNCKAFGAQQYPFEENIQYFDRVENIDYEFINRNNRCDKKKYIDYFSINHFIQTIDEGIGTDYKEKTNEYNK